MHELIETIRANTMSTLPVPNAPITTRLATMDDLPFIDRLQKQHSKQLGFFPRAQLEGYVRNGWMLIAESAVGATYLSSGERDDAPNRPMPGEGAGDMYVAPTKSVPIGYCAFRDRYLKRDELGAIFQLCVDAGVQRKLVGATLLRSVFERSSYGTRLYCCWCAQDLAANRFWEAMGFVPLAYRAGSEKKARVHVFWQKRIRSGDASTPWWFPSGTGGGALRGDRIVLPIPPGTHWSEAKPLILPAAEKAIEDESFRAGCNPADPVKRRKTAGVRPALQKQTARKVQNLSVTGLRFGPLPAEAVVEEKVEKPKRVKKQVKNDPRLVSAARELRDRWLEQVNAGADVGQIALPAAKYEVSRALGAAGEGNLRLLEAA